MEAYKKELEEYNKSVASTLEKIDSWCQALNFEHLDFGYQFDSLISDFNFSIGVWQLYFLNLNKNSNIYLIHVCYLPVQKFLTFIFFLVFGVFAENRKFIAENTVTK